jgi:cytochrome c-type biogenesis protein CcmH/NrfG
MTAAGGATLRVLLLVLPTALGGRDNRVVEEVPTAVPREARLQEELPIVGDCRDDAETLAGEADALLLQAGPGPPAATLERARRLYRRARLLSPSALFSLRAADLACAAGDEEECGDLLSQAAEADENWISPAERLLLARRAEARRRWREAIAHYQALRAAAAADVRETAWVEGKIRGLEVEIEAEAISVPVAAQPSPEARLALAEARRALSVGDLAKARERLTVARRLSHGYVEAALALAALETREGRAPEAIRAYREALSSDPGRFEALVGLANVLWDEPDRSAKEESLSLVERALASRPDAASLLKTSALRWAEWGDAAKALDRLDAYRRRASREEKRATEDLRETLARRVDAQLSGTPEATEEPEVSESSSPAIGQWKVAQAYFRRGDPASLAAALEHLEEAERLDPAFGRAPELAGAVHERRGELAPARAAYERAILADPSRVATFERLALLLERQPDKQAEAEEAWRRAEQAGSSEALFHLAGTALRAGRRGEALSLYRRYLAESPAGVHTEEVSRAIEELEFRGRTVAGALAGAIAVLLVAAGVVAYRRVTGRTFEQWIRAEPARARDARPIVGRLRHEVVKHGGLLLADAARKLSEPDPDARRVTARLLLSRLFGAPDSEGRGLIRESSDVFDRIQGLAREDGIRLNLERKDPLFSPIAKGSRLLRRLAPALRRIADPGSGLHLPHWGSGLHLPHRRDERAVRRAAADLRRAAELFRANSGAEMSRVLDEASSTDVSFAALQAILARVCAEKGLDPPLVLEPLGLFRQDSSRTVAVRVDRGDLETIWRNLLANALDAAGTASDVRLGVSAELFRDPVTGTPTARFILADNVPAALTTEMIRGRGADRGWGVVADLVRRHEGVADVGPAPATGYRKGIVLELPALEWEVPA